MKKRIVQPSQVFESATFTGESFDGPIDEVKFVTCTFKDCRFADVAFKSTNFVNCLFQGVLFSNCDIIECRIEMAQSKNDQSLQLENCALRWSAVGGLRSNDCLLKSCTMYAPPNLASPLNCTDCKISGYRPPGWK